MSPVHATTTYVDDAVAGAVGGAPAGAVTMFGGSAAPSGWLLCDGASYLRADYAALFTAIGTNHGAADGTHFNVPDMRGRVPVGLDGSDTDFDAVGEARGAKTVVSTGSVAAPVFTGTALGTHLHAAGTYLPSAHAGTAVAAHASHTHTYTEVPNHVHVQHTNTATTGTTGAGVGAAVDASTSGDSTCWFSTSNPTGGVVTGTTAGPSASLTHLVTQPDAHTMAGSSEAVSAGTPAGTNNAPAYTGIASSVVQPSRVMHFIIKT